MIPQLTQIYKLNAADQDLIDALKPFNGKSWKDNNIEGVKAQILMQLLHFQNYNCCYCGLRVNETGRGEIDHIAKKGGPKRPAYVEYVFTPKNLAVACQYCNSSSKKGQEDVVSNFDPNNYDNCTFTIVHPYNDNPTLHYQWTTGQYRILISGASIKGIESIRIFELDKEPLTTARAKQAMFEKKLRRYQLGQAVMSRIRNILLFKR